MSKQKPKKKKQKTSFNPGDVIVFEPNNFNQDYWKSLSEEEKNKYYGSLGYGIEGRKKLFVYVCPINDPEGFDSGHHIMVDLATSQNHVMRHSLDFRKATWEEI